MTIETRGKPIVGGDGLAIHVFGASCVVVAGLQCGDQRIVEGLRLLSVKLKAAECEIDRAVEHQPGEMIAIVRPRKSARIECHSFRHTARASHPA